MFMQHDCAACHSMLPYAGLAEPAAGRGEMEAKVAEIVVVHEAARSEPAAAATLHGGACPPDLSVITKVNGHILFSNHRTSSAATYHSIAHTSCSVLFMQNQMLGGLRHNHLFNAEELKKRMALPLPNPVWLQFLQPHRT